jgi:putative phage-type endonuclease
MLTDQQLAARRNGLGGSDSAAALGLSPWKTALELWAEKSGQITAPAEISEPMRWGNLLEPVIRQEYAERTGRTVVVPPETLVHPTHKWMRANVDGIAEVARLFEAKTARTADGWGEPGSDEIPQPYLIQVQHYLHVTAFPVADVAVLIGGSDFRLYEVPADRELQDMIVDGEAEFWRRVESGEPPEPDFGSDRALDFVRRMFPGTNGERITADAVLENWRAVLDDAAGHRDRYAAVADMAKAHLLYAMGTAAELSFADGKALRRREVTRKGYTVQASTYIDARFVAIKE